MANTTTVEHQRQHEQSLTTKSSNIKKKKNKKNDGIDFLQKSSKILDEIDQAPIFKNQLVQKFPAFCQNDLAIGKLLGKGTVGYVNEITFVNHLSSESATTITNDDIHIDDNQHHKEAMIARAVRDGKCRYAMKYLRPNLKEQASSKKAVRAQLDLAIEVKYLQAIHHPCIIKLRALPSDIRDIMDPNYFFLMDRLEGTLDQRMRVWRNELRECQKQRFLGIIPCSKDKDKKAELLERRLLVTADVASACKYMHSHQLLHRDLKPQNIGFDIRGDVKVFDLGLAKSLLPQNHARGGLYHLTGMTGSMPYMAPEVARKEPYNETCDVFSFGILVWEIVSLQQAFKQYSYSRKELYDKIVVKGIRPPLHKIVPSGLKRLLPRCWVTSLKQRPSMEEVWETLQSSICCIGENRTEWLMNQSGRSQRGNTKSSLKNGSSSCRKKYLAVSTQLSV